MSLNLENHLNDLQWNDLKKFAKDNGIKVAGTREVITSEILSTLGDAPVQALGDCSNKKAGFESPMLQVPKKSRFSTRKSARKTPAKENFVVVLPEEQIEFPIEQSTVEEEIENVEPKSLFPSSPEVHVRQSRKPMLRSPSPAKSPEPKMNKARTPAKSKTPAKSIKSVTRSARKAAQDEHVNILPAEVEATEVPTVAEPEAKNEVTADVETIPVSAPIDTKNTLSLVGAFSVIAVIAAFFLNGSPAAPATPNWSNSISLKGSSTVYMTQGDVYEEQGVAFAPEIQKAILDGKSSPTISYEYSQPAVAFSDFLADVGSFNVEYQVSSPWLGEISLTRQVIVSDVNECTYSGNNDVFKHNCSPSQTCQNSIGSFSCV